MIQNILKYQNTERNLRKIENEIHSCNERIKAQKAKKFLIESEESVNKMDKRAKDLLVLLEKTKKSYNEYTKIIKEYQDTIETLTSEDEVLYLSKKVKEINDKLKYAEKEIISISKDMEELLKSFANFKSKYNEAKIEYKQNRKAYENIKLGRAKEIDKIKTMLNDLSKKIKPDVFEKYNKKRADKIFPVLVPCRDNMCGGCSMQISLKEMDKLKSEKIIECENCHRLIYVD